MAGARRLPRWLAPGDWNAFFGLALDNTTVLVILAGLLIGVFKFPPDLVLGRMVPGTAVGVLIGDLVYTTLAVRLMRRTGRADVTAMPFGIDTPSLFGIVFGVLGPARLLTGDPVLAWKIGMGVTVAMGGLKLLLSFGGDWLRRVVPRAALLGSIAGVGILLIAFLPALRVFADPLVGVTSLTIVLLTLVGGVRLPGGVPGAFAGVLAGAAVFWLRAAAGAGGATHAGPSASLTLAIPWPTLAWMPVLGDVLAYLPLAVPFALATVIGGIDNTESAVAAGDEYRTRDVLLTEAVATIAAGLCGGVIQNTPYIGHPAYKAMGARAGYTLATALVIGVGAALGVISVLVRVLPEAAVAPILIFVGLQITAQAFVASPARHGAAVAIAFVPAIAALVLIEVNQMLAAAGRTVAELSGEGQAAFRNLLVLGNGFIVTALLWAWALVSMIDRWAGRAAAVLGACAVATLFGLMHSPLPSGAVFWPWGSVGRVPVVLAGAYGGAAILVLLLGRRTGTRSGPLSGE
ncbi:MAG TPA: MFS transporter [Candidatus Bathyarchaeia archaeon]|nr:MFS transporter [Candidatus Bathyarchaeia archaeon]